jgi:hypothetical protein
MTAEEWALAASVFFSGLAAGFLGGLCTILRPMQAAMTGPEFRNFMERFLRYADNGLGKVFNYAWSGGTTIAAIVALVLLWDDPGSTSFVLTAIGLAVVIVGILVVSNVWKTPTYKLILRQQTIAALIILVITLMVAWVPLVLAAVVPGATTRLLPWLGHWMNANNRWIQVVLGFGVWLLAKGVNGL